MSASSPAGSSTSTAASAASSSAAGLSTMAAPGIAAPTKRSAKLRRGKKPGPAKNKYLAKGKRVDGHFFHSSAEATRYEQLKALEQAGVIAELELQPKYPMVINNQSVGTYIADFRYKVIDELGNTIRIVVEDVKGMMTDLYALKRKVVHALYPVTIEEIPAGKIAAWANRIP